MLKVSLIGMFIPTMKPGLSQYVDFICV